MRCGASRSGQLVLTVLIRQEFEIDSGLLWATLGWTFFYDGNILPSTLFDFIAQFIADPGFRK